jgi:hypothetical protein
MESALISIVCGPTQKAFRKWVWTVIEETSTIGSELCAMKTAIIVIEDKDYATSF